MAFALGQACAPASPDEVARFVERVAWEELERRAKLAAEAESYDASGSSVVARAPAALESGVTLNDVTSARLRRPRRLLAPVLLSLGVAFAIGGLAVARRATPTSLPQKSDEPYAPTPPVAPSTSAPAPSVAATPTSSTPHVSADPAGDPRPARRPLKGAATVKPRAPIRPPPCQPPYSIDEKGLKRYKPECLP